LRRVGIYNVIAFKKMILARPEEEIKRVLTPADNAAKIIFLKTIRLTYFFSLTLSNEKPTISYSETQKKMERKRR